MEAVTTHWVVIHAFVREAGKGTIVRPILTNVKGTKLSVVMERVTTPLVTLHARVTLDGREHFVTWTSTNAHHLILVYMEFVIIYREAIIVRVIKVFMDQTVQMTLMSVVLQTR